MRPIGEFPLAERAAVRVVLTDIDDTMTDDGMLPSGSLAAMEQLSAAGLKVIPVTGRPAGWCDHFARMWPIDAIVGENGALWFSYDRAAKRMKSGYVKSDAERTADRAKLDALREEILREVPGAGIASDQFCRIADLAIDFCEDVPPLPRSEVDRIVALFERAGATAKVSSIHVNGWFGSYDKLTTSRTCLNDLFGIDIDADNAACVFVGDSPNDQPMFRHFAHGIGVANVRDFDLGHPPRWVTPGRGAAGFMQVAEALLQSRDKAAG